MNKLHEQLTLLSAAGAILGALLPSVTGWGVGVPVIIFVLCCVGWGFKYITENDMW